MKLIHSAKKFTIRLAAAGVMSAVLVALPAAESVASPHKELSDVHHKVAFGVLNAKGGTAALTVDPAVATGAAALGIGLAPIANATAVGNVWSFPVLSGRIMWMTRPAAGGTSVTRLVGGALRLDGGITATKGVTTVTITRLVADLNEGRNGKVEANISGIQHHRVNALVITSPTVNAVTRTATADLNLSELSAKLLNKALSTTSFKRGMKIGTVVVTVPAPV